MVLEITQEANIKSLALEEPAKEFKGPFSPETEITQEDWRHMVGVLGAHKINRDWGDFAKMAMNMKILFPERVGDLELNSDLWKTVKIWTESTISHLNHYPQLGEIAAVKYIFPEEFAQTFPDLKDSIHPSLWEIVDFRQQCAGYETAYLDLVRIFGQDPGLPPPNQQKTKTQLEKYRKESDNLDDGLVFASFLEEYKLLFPEDFSNLNLNETDWEKLRNVLEWDRDEKNWFSFSFSARQMKIIAAEKVTLTDQGYEIIMPPLEIKKSPEERLPETRKF